VKRSNLMFVLSSRLLRVLPLAGALALAGAALSAGPADAAPGCMTSGGQVTCLYGFTGAEQTFTVPSGVSSVQVTAVGAAGAPSFGSPAPPGGLGAEVTGTLTGLTVGEILYVEVGGIPTLTGACFNGVSCIGGFNGGGFSGYGGGGGGASDVRTSPSADPGSLTSRLIVAAGGGGGGEPGINCDTAGTAGGNAGGQGGSSNCAGIGDSTGGEPGTQTAGGPGGSPVGGQGTLGGGGTGSNLQAGAGGGGLYGGGGGGGLIFTSDHSSSTAAGGGGGGSSLVPPGGTESVTSSPALVTISYTAVQPLRVTTTSLPAATGGRPYTAALAATGGVPPYAWTVTSGSLPPGLTLDASTGVISGTSDVAGTYDFTVTATDSESPAMTASAALSVSVTGPVITELRPDSGPAYGRTPVIIVGTGLSCPRIAARCQVRVTFGGRPALVEFVRPGEIRVIDPAGSRTVTVTVTVGRVSSQATAATEFTYRSLFGFLS
jgi:hypothetical protein